MTSLRAIHSKEATKLSLRSFRFQQDFEEIKGVFQSFDEEQRKFVLEQLRSLCGELTKKPFVDEEFDPKFAELNKLWRHDLPGLIAGLPDRLAPPMEISKPEFEDILRAVSRISGISSFNLKGPCRKPSISYNRGLTIYLIREFCDDASFPKIGAFMLKDHTSCMAAYRKTPERLMNNKRLRRIHDQVCIDLGLDKKV